MAYVAASYRSEIHSRLIATASLFDNWGGIHRTVRYTSREEQCRHSDVQATYLTYTSYNITHVTVKHDRLLTSSALLLSLLVSWCAYLDPLFSKLVAYLLVSKNVKIVQFAEMYSFLHRGNSGISYVLSFFLPFVLSSIRSFFHSSLLPRSSLHPSSHLSIYLSSPSWGLLLWSFSSYAIYDDYLTFLLFTPIHDSVPAIFIPRTTVTQLGRTAPFHFISLGLARSSLYPPYFTSQTTHTSQISRDTCRKQHDKGVNWYIHTYTGKDAVFHSCQLQPRTTRALLNVWMNKGG